MLNSTKNLPQWEPIDTDPANIAEMATRGSFFSHQDGVWRYYPFDRDSGVHRVAENVVEQFEHLLTHGPLSAACDPKTMQVARIHADGTRGIHGKWSRDTELTLRSLYGFRDDNERDLTAEILEVMP